MKIRCAHCPARYTVPEEKVRGRKVKIKCKKCGEPIYVDGTKLGASGPPAVATSAPPLSPRPSDAATSQSGPPEAVSSPAPTAAPTPARSGTDEAPQSNAEVTSRAGVSEEPARAPSPSGPRAAASPTRSGAVRSAHGHRDGEHESTPAEQGDVVSTGEPRWTVALDAQTQAEWTLAELIDAFAQGTIQEGTYIWREGMADWTTPLQVPAVAETLRSLGIVPRASERTPGSARYGGDEELATVVAPSSSQYGFTWRDQAYDGDAQRSDAPAFDDVTVALPEERVSALAQGALDDDDEVTRVVRSPLDGNDPITRALTASLADTDNDEPAILMQRPAAGRPPEPPPESRRERPLQRAPTSTAPAREEEDSVVFSLDALIRAGQSSLPPPPPKPKHRDDAALMMSPGFNAFAPAPPMEATPDPNAFPTAPFATNAPGISQSALAPQPFMPSIPPTASLSDSDQLLEMPRRRGRAALFWLSTLFVLLAALTLVYLLRPELLGL